MENYITDKQIKDETYELMKECRKEVDGLFADLSVEERGLWSRTAFIYLKDHLFNHSHKFYRDKEKGGK